MEPTLVNYVLDELATRKGDWPAIAKAIQPDSWESYYSWLTKFASGKIPDPSVNKIQELADYFGGFPPARRPPGNEGHSAAESPEAA